MLLEERAGGQKGPADISNEMTTVVFVPILSIVT